MPKQLKFVPTEPAYPQPGDAVHQLKLAGLQQDSNEESSELGNPGKPWSMTLYIDQMPDATT